MTLVDFHHVELTPPPNLTQHVHIQTCTYRLMVITLSMWWHPSGPHAKKFEISGLPLPDMESITPRPARQIQRQANMSFCMQGDGGELETKKPVKLETWKVRNLELETWQVWNPESQKPRTQRGSMLNPPPHTHTHANVESIAYKTSQGDTGVNQYQPLRRINISLSICSTHEYTKYLSLGLHSAFPQQCSNC